MLLAVEGNLGRAIEEATAAVSIWEATPKREGVQLASALNVLAAVYCRAKRWPEAEEANTVGQALAERFSLPFHFASPEEPDDTAPRWWDSR